MVQAESEENLVISGSVCQCIAGTAYRRTGNFTTEKVHEYVFSTIVDSFHDLKYSRLGGLT